MKSYLIAVVVMLGASAWAQDPDETLRDDPRGSPAVRDALAARLVACVDSPDAGVSPSDRAVIEDMSAALLPAVSRGVCSDAGEPVSPSACVSRLEQMDCDALARALGPGAGAAAVATPAPWAAGLARALTERIQRCSAEERDGAALDDAERETLRDFERELSRALTTLGSGGVCVANENLLPACAVSVGAAPCEGLGRRLEEDPTQLARSVTPQCLEMVRCGAAALDDGAAGADDDAAISPP